MTTDIVEELALSAAPMQPLGLEARAYFELPPRIIVIDPSDIDHDMIDEEHVEIVARCQGCGRPTACKAKIENGRIVADGPCDHPPPLTSRCGAHFPQMMSAFRRLVYQSANNITH